jgi:hypothetical protein
LPPSQESSKSSEMSALRAHRRLSASKKAVAAGPLPIWFSRRNDKAKRDLSRVIATATAPVVERVLRATNPDELEYALQELTDYDVDAARGYQLLRRASNLTDLNDEREQASLNEEVVECIGQEACRIITNGLPWINEFIRLARRYVRPTDVAEEPTARVGEETLGEYLNGLDVPAVLWGIASENIKGNLAGMALFGAVERKRRMPAWLGALLAERYIQGMRAAVRVLGSVGPEKPNPELVPANQLLDVEALVREYAEAKTGADLLMMEHRQSGRAVSYPFGGPGDDD